MFACFEYSPLHLLASFPWGTISPLPAHCKRWQGGWSKNTENDPNPGKSAVSIGVHLGKGGLEADQLFPCEVGRLPSEHSSALLWKPLIFRNLFVQAFVFWDQQVGGALLQIITDVVVKTPLALKPNLSGWPGRVKWHDLYRFEVEDSNLPGWVPSWSAPVK